MIISKDENLQHILQETAFLISTSKDIDELDFEHNEILKKAFLRSLENLDHHVKKYTEESGNGYLKSEWKNIAQHKKKLIYNYEDTDFKAVWDLVRNKIPLLEIQLKEFVENEEHLLKDEHYMD